MGFITVGVTFEILHATKDVTKSGHKNQESSRNSG